jgi:tripartite-type tricarboxylate transporter receptor subunit TctC
MKHMAARSMLFGTLACIASVAWSAAADPAANYPNRPVRFIAPFVAGGPSDYLSRLLASKLTEAWGQQVVVDNRGSSGGIVGFELGAKAPPDGYTLTMAASSGLTVNPAVYIKLPYDPVKDFEPITQITSGSALLVIHPSVPAKTMPEFIALAKAKPGIINFGATGAGNLLASEMLNHMAGIKLIAINYKGTGQAITALLSNEVQMFFINMLIGVPQIKAGKLRALGITSAKRHPNFPDIPAISETVPGFSQVTWHSVVVPAKTPAPLLDKLNADLVKIIKSADVRERFAAQGLDAVGSSREELRMQIAIEIKQYADIVKQIGYKPQ